MTTTTITYKDYNLKVKYNYYPPYPASYENDGAEGIIEIDSILLGDTDIFDLIDDHIDEIEELIVKSWEE